MKMNLPVEMYDSVEVEEALAKGIEQYEKGEVKLKSDSKIKQFYDYLLEQFKNFLQAIGLSKGNLINEYYDILLYEESVAEEFVKLSTGNELTPFIENEVLDLSSISEVDGDVQMKEKMNVAINEYNKLVEEITKIKK